MKKSMRVILGDLRGPAGNAYAIMGACKGAIDQYRQAGAITKQQADAFWDEFEAEATSDDYDHLIATVDEYFIVQTTVGELRNTTAKSLLP